MPAQYEAPAWGQSPYADLKVPSGGLVQAKRLDMAAVVAAGLMEEFDALSPTIQENVVGPAKGRRPQDRQPKKLTKKQQAEAEVAATRKLLQSKDDMTALSRLLALIIPVVVIQPSVISHFEKDAEGNWRLIEPSERIDGAIYTDSIPLGDQMFILQWAMEGMDMTELQQFRQQPDERVDDVEDVADA